MTQSFLNSGKFWRYLPISYQGYGILFKIFKGIWDTRGLINEHVCSSIRDAILLISLKTLNSFSMLSRATIGLPAKRHLKGVSLAGRCWLALEYLPGSSLRRLSRITVGSPAKRHLNDGLIVARFYVLTKLLWLSSSIQPAFTLWQLSARQQNTIEMAFRWVADGGPLKMLTEFFM